MKINIIQVGKTKDKWLIEGIEEYLKRLTAFTNVEVIELADVSLKISDSSAIVKEREAQSILKRLNPEDYVVLLDEQGKEKTSLEFAEFLINISDRKNVVFIIGGVFGVDELIKNRADMRLALSKMTFTHRMARLILCEQLYRAMMINSNRSYHV